MNGVTSTTFDVRCVRCGCNIEDHNTEHLGDDCTSCGDCAGFIEAPYSAADDRYDMQEWRGW